MEDSFESEVGSLDRRERLPNGNSVLSPTKSSSTSEEEGQFEESRKRRLAKQALVTSTTATSSALPSSSSAPAIVPASSGVGNQRERSPLTTRRQTSGNQSDYWRSDAGETSNHSGLASRIRGYEADAPASSRWPNQRDERRSHHTEDARRRQSPQTYNTYDRPSSRSTSIGAHDDRYQEHRYSPTSGRYEDREREREWEAYERDADRVRERERWQREREWELAERDRERSRDGRDGREWSRPPYARMSSPSHPSSAGASEAARAYSGSWSGPVSPSATRRDRYLSGQSWDRDRERDRVRVEQDDRDRDRDWERERERIPSGGLRHSVIREESVQSRFPHSRTSPLRDPRDNAGSYSRNRGSAPHLHRAHTSSSPSAIRSPEQRREMGRDIIRKREESVSTAKATPEEESPAARDVSSPLDRIQPSVQKSQIVEVVEAPKLTEIKSEIITDAPLEAVPEIVSQIEEVQNIGTSVAEAVMNESTTEAAVTSTLAVLDTEAEKKEDVIATIEDVQSSQAGDLIASVPTEELERVDEATTEKVDEATTEKVDGATTDEVDEATTEKVDEATTEKVDEATTDKVDEATTEKVTEKLEADKDVQMSADLPVDAIDEATLLPQESEKLNNEAALKENVRIVAEIPTNTTEEMENGFMPNLDLENVEMDVSIHDAPLPTPRTKEEQDNNRRMTVLKLLKLNHFSQVEVAKVFVDNRKLLTHPTFKPLESAIHGEYPRKNHIEPWLDDEEEEVQNMRRKMMKCALNRQKRLNEKVEALRTRYKELNRDWQRHCARLDRMSEARESHNRAMGIGSSVSGATSSISLLPGSGNSVGNTGGIGGASQSTDEPSIGITAAFHPSMTRANRRNTQTGFAGFGDAVRSEAEFLEILATLENADMQDPNMRAARTTATEPEMIINPDEKKLLLSEYDDDNGFVADPVAFYCSDFDPDYWTEEEKVIFERRYALFPKQFGKIAASLPHKTSKQCVAYYYLTKHAGQDYKSLSAARNRDRKRKSRVKPKKGRGSALMADLKGDDVDEDDQQSPGEVLVDESNVVSLSSSRKGGASSRARMLTTSTASGDLGMVAEEEGGDDSVEFSVGGSRKRRIEDTSTDEPAVRKTSTGGTKAKRPRSDKKSRRNSTVSKDALLSQPVDPDMAAAEALGALAGGIASSVPTDTANEGVPMSNSSNRRKKSTSVMVGGKPVDTPGEDGIKRSRQTTSSYWSVAERNEFLRSLAVYEKNWDAIASTLSTKSAAQARNYYARNVDEADFVEAIKLGKEIANLSLPERQEQAMSFIQKRGAAMLTSEGQQRSSQNMAPQSGYFSGNTPAARGLNINSLLNTEDDVSSNAASRRASMSEWFNKEVGENDSNDDTEDEEQDEEVQRAPAQQYQQQQQQQQQYQRHEREPSDYFDGVGRSSRYATDYASPAGHPVNTANPRYAMAQLHRQPQQATLSSMPPPSAFLSSSRYQLPGHRMISDNQRSPLAHFQQQQYSHHQGNQHGNSPDGYLQQQRYQIDRDSNTRGGWSSAASTPPSIISQSPQGVEQQRHSSWPNVHSPANLGPASQFNHNTGRVEASSLSPFGGPPRSSSTSLQSMTSSARSPFDRPQSNNGQISSIRSLSPHPPPQYHQQQQQYQQHQSQQQQQHQSQQQQNPPQPRLPPINQSLFSVTRDSTNLPHQ